ncbi:MAG TPA: hypothetical protein VGQ42_05330 [Candidatus Dormibacteraeota bacterium]|jgi:hypothetical protein|nr:hypothetical protein [Candidatus Dormibacteraeota bacterium]
MLIGFAGTALAVVAGDAVLVSVGHAAQDESLAANYGIYNGQVATAADRQQVGTEVDVGFSGGVVNNFYPLARVDVSVAGNSAAATPADTGPFAQAVFAGQNVTQPQYVNAQYPGTQNPPGYSAGSATASASVTPASGTAAATYGAAGNTTTVPAGAPADGSDAGTANASSFFDSTLGFVTTGDSRVHHASYGGGVLTIDNVHVSVKIGSTGNGSFSKAISVTVGAAFVNVGGTAVPVTIDQNGVTVQQQNAPLDAVQAVNATINAALAQAGLSVHAVAPQVAQEGDNLHVDAEGVVIDHHQTGTPNGVPKQFVRHTLGVVVLDNEAIASPAQPTVDIPATPTDLGTPAAPVFSTNTITTTSGDSSAASGTTPPPPPAPAPAPPAAAPPRPSMPVLAVLTEPHSKWLLLAYLAWQALMIALVGALYLHRAALRRVP